MSNIVIVGFTTEGTTDMRFLESVIRRTFEDVAFSCESDITVHEVLHINGEGDSFVESLLDASENAHKSGVMVLCAHADSDAADDKDVLEFKMKPALEAFIQKNSSSLILIPIVPIYMTEAWMLADKELLKHELDTNKSDIELGINVSPESISQPKNLIKNSIRIATSHLPRRRQRLEISELYLPIGQQISLDKLMTLVSYQKFRKLVQDAFVELNFLRK